MPSQAIVAMKSETTGIRQAVAGAQDRVAVVRGRAQRTLLWQVWDRMLEIEFVGRSVALRPVRWRVLIPSGVVTGVAVAGYARRQRSGSRTS